MLRSSAQAALNRLAWLVGTGLGSGLAPLAPGTAASMVALVIYYFLPISGDSAGFYVLVGAGFLVGVGVTGSLTSPTDRDPHWVVWDEFVGMWATCLLLPQTIPWLAAAFFSFRALDILKPWPVNWLERLPRGWGIMADDLAAGLYGAALLNAFRLAFFS